MTTLREAAQQALEALYEADTFHRNLPDQRARRLAAMAALRAALAQQEEPCPNCASLEAQNTELDQKLAELEQAKPVQEPVAWRHKGAGHFTTTPLVSMFPEWEPLYTSPPQRKPLTEEEIYKIYNDFWRSTEAVDFARAIERAHGIKE